MQTGSISYVPVHFLYKSIDPDELTALYAASDVCLVASTRDGMNLVCYEYIACHYDPAVRASEEIIPAGSLVLSRFAGAAGYLRNGAFIVNPWDGNCCADALARALEMDVEEASSRMGSLGKQLERQTR
jgi:trehalose 6-phosphate synthase